MAAPGVLDDQQGAQKRLRQPYGMFHIRNRIGNPVKVGRFRALNDLEQELCPPKVRFAADSPVEGFEPSVPRLG